MTSLLAVRAPELLAEFNRLGVLSVADVHVAQRLGALAAETDERVLLAVALLVRSTRQGSVVLDLAEVADTVTAEDGGDEAADDRDAVDPATGATSPTAAPLVWPATDEWAAACASSPLVAEVEGGPPVRQVGTRLWLSRYWRQESVVADELLRRSSRVGTGAALDLARLRADLDDLFRADTESDQRLATAVAALSPVSVIAGGPGTGKTTTIARLLAVLLRQQPDARIALAAPTGKAAAHLEEAVRAAGDPLGPADRAALQRLSAVTIHRLLGRRPGSAGRFRHDRDNRLPYDVIVVDESSMVSLTLMARLLEAVPTAGRIVLVGDPDQLASVEAGAVLGDLVDPDDVGPVRAELAARLEATGTPVAGGRPDGTGAALRESVTLLRRVRRFDRGGAIATLAEHVRAGRADAALDLLRAGRDELQLHENADDEPLGDAAIAALQRSATHERAVIDAARAGDAGAALDALDRHRLLCAHRTGPRGVRMWATTIERWLGAADPTLVPRLDGRYAGQPLLVTANDYENELFNGDVGVVVERDGELIAAFRRGGADVSIPLVRLSDGRPMHAMTIHRAQGSQFDDVTVLLPLAGSPLATRQTFYTAITRAVSSVTVIGSADAVRTCIERPTARATGLRDRLAGRLG
ncbi:MAG: exodeoxyribonuclease V subunit alpha [Jatrophihabitans sp.]|uniref:exodeoxyribonuclease V subunit alpha n=1 Tax=Jatrophihabitans sp. TaxID=1932789 RepID=UPI003F7E2132